MNIQDWFNETTLNVASKLDHFDEFGEHPQFTGWCYGGDYTVIYVMYSDGTEISYNYFSETWTC